MTKTTFDRAAFVNLRVLSVLALCMAGALLCVFAFSPGLRLQATSQNASTPRHGGGSAPLNREASEVARAASQNEAAAAYTGPQNDMRPVHAVRSGELRHVHPIHPSKAPKHDHPEP